MNTNRNVALLTLTIALAISNCAQASSAPTSQFGFSGWPYRQSTSCGSANACQNNDTCPTATCAPSATSCPSAVCPSEMPCATPEVTPTATPTQEPTPAPSATPSPSPSPSPTVQPTQAPTAKPTQAPTAKPTATKMPVATVSPAPTATAPSTGGDYTTGSISVQEENAYRLLNADRQSNGRSALSLDTALCGLARLKSEDMNANHYFAHTSPTLGSAANMLRAHGYAFNAVGENIAHHATVEKAQAAFMSSSGHRTNILGSQWTKVGVGVCFDSNGYIYETQLFVR